MSETDDAIDISSVPREDLEELLRIAAEMHYFEVPLSDMRLVIADRQQVMRLHSKVMRILKQHTDLAPASRTRGEVKSAKHELLERKIVEMRDDNWKVQDIADKLNDDGFRTKRNRVWDYSAVYYVLTKHGRTEGKL